MNIVKININLGTSSINARILNRYLLSNLGHISRFKELLNFIDGQLTPFELAIISWHEVATGTGCCCHRGYRLPRLWIDCEARTRHADGALRSVTVAGADHRFVD